ncbi:MAG: glycosyl hydrolase family 18 [Clostridiales bacterium]|nr:glycosyl hydrolase family 18 [Clostridiales bacterium]
MERKSKIAITGITFVILVIVISLGVMIKTRLTPSNEVMLLTDYYDIENDKALIILHNRVYEEKALVINGRVYMDYETVVQKFNHRFYWDINENILIYTTPNEIIQAEAGSKQYSITKSMIKTQAYKEYSIVEVFANDVYVALDFIEEYSDIDVRYYEEPNRVVINYKWGEYLYTEVEKETQIRIEPNIKSSILVELKQGASLIYADLDEAPKKGFVKVMTEDGVIGYVKEKHVKEGFYKSIESDFVEPVYTTQTRPYTINMVFHQVFNNKAAGALEELLKETKGVNVVSPTWFSITDVTGDISSLASHEYVNKAKELGVEVWALVDDFNSDVKMFDLLSHTSYRENLANKLVQAAIDYKINGINIDFENISSDAGKHYIQFLRELSVKCRNNGIVLSVDNYVPAPYNRHYDLEEQGKIIDYLIIMAYDEHYAGSDVAGPVASLGFVKDAIDNTIAIVPNEKTIIAIPFYSRLWKESKDGDVSSEAYAMTPASNIFKDNGVELEWNETIGSYYGEFEKDDLTYKMWLEDPKSIEEKMKIIYEADTAGIAAWKLGLEKQEVWNVITRYLK